MASKKYLELQGHSDDDLRVELTEAQRQYRQMRFDHYSRGIESPAGISNLRRDIARIQTEIRRRELSTLNDGAGRPPRQSRRQRLQSK